MRNGEPRSVMNHSHHSLTQDNIISTASTCPFLTLAQTQGLCQVSTPCFLFFIMKTKLSWLAFFSLSFPNSLSFFFNPAQGRKSLFLKSWGFVYNTRLYLFPMEFGECCSPPNELMIISDKTCHLFTKRPYIIFFKCFILSGLAFSFLFFITYSVTLTIIVSSLGFHSLIYTH